MLIEFRSEHDGSLVMFGKAATQILNMMGTSGRSEGALRSEDVASALASLRAALSALAERESDEDSDDSDDDVPINRRAVPVIDLLEKTVANSGYFMWKEKN